MSSGRFFEKRGTSADGRFLRDLPGKLDGHFHKAAAPAPSSEDLLLPTGFHRPTREQPEDLEAGGERFHSTEAQPADFGAGKGLAHAMTEGGRVHVGANASGQMGKHAAPRFLGTSMEKRAYPHAEDVGDYAGSRFDEFKDSAKKGLSAAGDLADQGVKKITRSPVAALIAAGLAGKFIGGGLRRGAGAIGGMFRRGGGKAVSKSGGLIAGVKKYLS